MKRTLWVAALLALSLVFISAEKAHAGFYKYVDKDGIVCITNNLQSVPDKYRDKVVIVQSISELQEEQAARMRTAALSEEVATVDERASTPAKRPFSVRVLITLVIGIVFASFLVALNKLPVPEKWKKLVSPARVTLISLFVIYLIVAHVQDAMRVFGLAGNAIEELEARQAEKGKKAGQAIKTIDTLLDGNLQKADQEQQK